MQLNHYKISASQESRSLSKHYLRFAILGIIITLIGFIPTYFRPLTENKEFALIYHLHGLFCASWLILFLVQTALINRNNHKLHMKLGFLGIFIAVGVVITLHRVEFVTATRELQSGVGLGTQTFLGSGLLDPLAIGSLITVAMVLRKKPEIHKRLTLLATIILLWVSWVRLRYYFPPFPGNFDVFGFGFAMLPIPIFWVIEWRAHGKIHPIMFKAGMLVILEQGLQVLAPYAGYNHQVMKLANHVYTSFGGELPNPYPILP